MSDTVQRIFQLMEQRHVSAYRVSQETGISQARISGWKTGKSNPKQDALEQLADYFGVSVDYLIGNTKEKEKPASQEADELIKSDPLAGQLFAAYGRVKEEFSQAEIDDITMIMEMLAEKKRRKREKGEE